MDEAYKNWMMAQTAKKNFRAGLGEAIQLFPNIQVLLVNELTRLYRPINGSFLEGYINQLLKANRIQVLQVQGGNIDLARFDQQLITMIKNQILYEDLQKKRMNSIIAFQNKRDSGKLCNGCHIFGIKYLGNDRLKVIPECAEIIKYIFDKICEHRSYRSIIQDCNERWGKEHEIFFYESSIYHIARQPIYAGYQYNTGRELIKNVQITGQEIIAFDQWQEVQEIISNKRTNYRMRARKNWLPLSGRLHCGNCGGRLIGYKDHGDLYYLCLKKLISRTHGECHGSRIRFDPGRRGNPALYDAVYPLLCVALIKKLNRALDLLKAKQEINDYEAKLQNMRKREEETFDLYTEGLATMDQLRILLRGHQQKKAALQKRLAEIKASSITGEEIKELETLSLKDLLVRIIEKDLPHGKYSELVGLADIAGTVYKERVVFHTVYGEVTLPRLYVKNRRWMPEWEITVHQRDPAKIDEHTVITIAYKTGGKKVLADWGQLKILAE